MKVKKEERERQGSKNMAQVQTELIKLKRELEVSQISVQKAWNWMVCIQG